MWLGFTGITGTFSPFFFQRSGSSTGYPSLRLFSLNLLRILFSTFELGELRIALACREGSFRDTTEPLPIDGLGKRGERESGSALLGRPGSPCIGQPERGRQRHAHCIYSCFLQKLRVDW